MTIENPLPAPRRVGKDGYPNSLLLIITLRPMRSSRRYRGFFECLRLHAREQGLLMAHRYGICIFFGAERICAAAHRRDLVNWLIDRPEVKEVHVYGLMHLRHLTHPQLARTATDISEADVQLAFQTLQCVAQGVIKYWQAYLAGKA